MKNDKELSENRCMPIDFFILSVLFCSLFMQQDFSAKTSKIGGTDFSQ